MIREQLKSTIQKPSVCVKMALITALFIPSLLEQIDITTTYAESFGDRGNMTVMVLLIHIFNYFAYYMDIFFVGFLLLIPDIVKNEYLERKSIMCCGTRKTAGQCAVIRIVSFTILYVLWFVVLTVVIGGVGLRDFSLEWPKFLQIMQRKIQMQGMYATGVVNLPIGTLEYPTVVVFALMLLRSVLGFIFLGLLAYLVIQLTGKTQWGLGTILILVTVTAFINNWGGIFSYCDASKPKGQQKVYLDVIKGTILPLFTSRRVTDDFMPWMKFGIAAGAVLSVLTALGIILYYRKGNLGDADRDE